MRTQNWIGGFLCLGMIVSASSALAVIVDVNAVTNCASDDSNAVQLALAAGSWSVTQIDTTSGGAFTAWSPWSTEAGCDPAGANCSQGWVMSSEIMAPDVPQFGLGIFDVYETPALAFANDAESTVITLPTAQTVSFWIEDTPCTDNRGGVSFEVLEAVPTMPSRGLLLLVAVLLIVGSGLLLRR